MSTMSPLLNSSSREIELGRHVGARLWRGRVGVRQRVSGKCGWERRSCLESTRELYGDHFVRGKLSDVQNRALYYSDQEQLVGIAGKPGSVNALDVNNGNGGGSGHANGKLAGICEYISPTQAFTRSSLVAHSSHSPPTNICAVIGTLLTAFAILLILCYGRNRSSFQSMWYRSIRRQHRFQTNAMIRGATMAPPMAIMPVPRMMPHPMMPGPQAWGPPAYRPPMAMPQPNGYQAQQQPQSMPAAVEQAATGFYSPRQQIRGSHNSSAPGAFPAMLRNWREQPSPQSHRYQVPPDQANVRSPHQSQPMPIPSSGRGSRQQISHTQSNPEGVRWGGVSATNQRPPMYSPMSGPARQVGGGGGSRAPPHQQWLNQYSGAGQGTGQYPNPPHPNAPGPHIPYPNPPPPNPQYPNAPYLNPDAIQQPAPPIVQMATQLSQSAPPPKSGSEKNKWGWRGRGGAKSGGGMFGRGRWPGMGSPRNQGGGSKAAENERERERLASGRGDWYT